jgi:hypothetical protein
MATRLITLLFLIILSALPCHAQTGQVKACRLTSRALSLRKSQAWTVLKGTVPANGKIEYRLKPTADLTLEAKLSKAINVRLDIYSLKPAKREVTRADAWTGRLSAGNEYSLVLSNCYGSKNDAFQLEVRAQ